MSNQSLSVKVRLIFFCVCPDVALCYIASSICNVILLLPSAKTRKTSLVDHFCAFVLYLTQSLSHCMI